MPRLATAVDGFLESLPEDGRPAARSVIHAWGAAGGGVAAGRTAVRLTGNDPGTGVPFTAAAVHAPHGGQPTRLEVARVLLQNHGVDEDAFTHWADDVADLSGFDALAKFPSIPLDDLDATQLARLVTALRDLCILVGQQS